MKATGQVRLSPLAPQDIGPNKPQSPYQVERSMPFATKLLLRVKSLLVVFDICPSKQGQWHFLLSKCPRCSSRSCRGGGIDF